MAMLYVAHDYSAQEPNVIRALEVTKRLQKRDLSNCYVCPVVMFGGLHNAISEEEELALRIDLLSVCDVLLIGASRGSFIDREIEFARLVGIEVKYDENRNL